MGRCADRVRLGQAGRRHHRRAWPAAERSRRAHALPADRDRDGPIVPAIALADGDHDAAVPMALPADASLPVERLIARLQLAHARARAARDGAAPHRTVRVRMAANCRMLPVGDALDDATVLIAGRGPLYPALSVAMGERVKLAGALSVEAAASHLNARDIDGIVVGDGFSPRMVEAFLTVLAQDPRFRDIPVAVIGEAPTDFADALPNIDHVAADPVRLVARMVPLVRMRAFDARLKRMLKSLDTEGMFDPETGLLTRDLFWHDLSDVMADAADRSHAAVGCAFLLRQSSRRTHQPRCRAPDVAPDTQYRFRHPRRRRRNPGCLHANRSAQHTCRSHAASPARSKIPCWPRKMPPSRSAPM